MQSVVYVQQLLKVCFYGLNTINSIFKNYMFNGSTALLFSLVTLIGSESVLFSNDLNGLNDDQLNIY